MRPCLRSRRHGRSPCGEGPFEARAGGLVSALFRLPPVLPEPPPIVPSLSPCGRRTTLQAAKRKTEMRVDGACHCGAIAYQADVEEGTANICHCLDCQTLTGSAFRVNIQ